LYGCIGCIKNAGFRFFFKKILIKIKMEKVQEFIAAIEREQAKRDITYPKMLKKLRVKLESNEAKLEEYLELQNTQAEQNHALRSAKYTMEDSVFYSENVYRYEIKELVREMDMRLRYYPIMIIRHQISKEDAEIEKRVWRELVEYFNERYCPSVEVKFLKTRCRIINN
jgi:hypothetical protein